jgi:hypothetical protein
LEAPGLENFFARSIDPDLAKQSLGVVDLLSDAMTTGSWQGKDAWLPNTIQIKLPRSRGELRLLTAGRRTDAEYFRRVQKLDFRDFYAAKKGGALLEGFRNELKSEFDFVLVDSRTGLTDIGGLCTVQLPDLIVLLFTPTKQALAGGVDIISRAAKARQRLPFERPVIPVLPVPSRLDVSSEFRLGQQWLDTFSRELADLFADWLPRTINPRTLLELLKLPALPYFSFGEPLPVLEQGTLDPTGLGYAYETLAALVAHDLEGVEGLVSDRNRYVQEYSDKPLTTFEPMSTKIFVSYSRKDIRYLKELNAHLAPLRRSRAISVWTDREIESGQNWESSIWKELADAHIVIVLVSADYLASDYAQAELEIILQGSHSGEVRVVPVVVRACRWQDSPLAYFQALDATGKDPEDRDLRWVEVASAIARMVRDPHY